MATIRIGDDAKGGVVAVRLVLEILELLAKQDSVGVSEVARLLGVTKARIFRHLRTLVDLNYAVQDQGSERYAAGPRLLALGRASGMAPHDVLVRIARPTMLKLRDRFGHSVNFSVVFGGSVSIVETLEGSSIIGVIMRMHEGLPLHSTAAGKLMLADMIARGEPLPPPPYKKFTQYTITDPDALRSELLRIQEQGWAGAPEETVLGINAISAPVYDHRREPVGMISLQSSIQFITRDPDGEMVDALCAAAAEITAALSL